MQPLHVALQHVNFDDQYVFVCESSAPILILAVTRRLRIEAYTPLFLSAGGYNDYASGNEKFRSRRLYVYDRQTCARVAMLKGTRSTVDGTAPEDQTMFIPCPRPVATTPGRNWSASQPRERRYNVALPESASLAVTANLEPHGDDWGKQIAKLPSRWFMRYVHFYPRC